MAALDGEVTGENFIPCHLLDRESPGTHMHDTP